MSYYIEYYKEKDTDPMVFLQRFRCTTEPIGGGTEHDEEGELVSLDAAVAAIEIAKKQLGWHPASELPPVDRNGNSKLMVVIDDNGLPNYAYFHSDNLAKFWVKAGDWNVQQPILSVKWWCYPPKEE